MRRTFMLVPALLLTACTASGKPGNQGQSQFSNAGFNLHPAKGDSVYLYPAKFVCGTPAGDTEPQLLAPGRYFTAINVRNRSSLPIQIRKRFALALPLERTGNVSTNVTETIGPAQAMTIACPDIRQHAGVVGANLAEGFAVIESPVELDVTAVYTAGAGAVSTMHVERCPGTHVAACEPLEMSLDSWTTNPQWKVVSTPAGPVAPFLATPVPTPNSNWSLTLNPARWVWAKLKMKGNYVYELQFCLCESFEDASITLRLFADDRANVFLNSTQILQQPSSTSIPPHFTGTPTSVTVNGPFQVGINVLRVVVQNDGAGDTGFALDGTLTAARGRCQ